MRSGCSVLGSEIRAAPKGVIPKHNDIPYRGRDVRWTDTPPSTARAKRPSCQFELQAICQWAKSDLDLDPMLQARGRTDHGRVFDWRKIRGGVTGEGVSWCMRERRRTWWRWFRWGMSNCRCVGDVAGGAVCGCGSVTVRVSGSVTDLKWGKCGCIFARVGTLGEGLRQSGRVDVLQALGPAAACSSWLSVTHTRHALTPKDRPALPPVTHPPPANFRCHLNQ